MNFLASSYLWLLPLISLPIIFHLLKKRNYKDINFSTLRFFNIIEDSSINKINLINILLLIIRTLIILFFIIIISKPYISGISRNTNNNDNDVCIIIVDNSYSNKNSLNSGFKKILDNIIDAYDDNTLIKITTIDKNFFIYDDIKRNFNKSNLKPIKTMYSSHYFNFEELLNNENYNNYNNRDLFIMSDLQRDLLINSDNYNLDNWNVFLYKLPTNKDIYISSLKVNNQFIKTNEIINLDITVNNNTRENFENEEIMLFIDGINVGSNICSISSNSKETYSFKTSIPTKGNHNCYFSLKNANNHFFNIEVSENINIALIYNYINETKFLLNALNAFNEISNNLTIKLFKQSDFNLNNDRFDCIIKFDTANLTNALLNKIYTHTNNLILIPTDELNLNPISDFFNIDHTYKKNITNIKEGYISIKSNLINDKNIKKIFSDNSILEVYSYFEIEKNKNSTVVFDNNNAFINTYTDKNKSLKLISSPLNIQSNNLPVNGSFIPLINEYIINSNNVYNYEVGDTIFFSNNNLNHKIRHINNKDTSSYNIDSLIKKGLMINKPGYHEYIDSDKSMYISSNISLKEYRYNVSSSDDISNLFPNHSFISNTKDLVEILNTQITGFHIWRYFLYAIIILIIIEMYLSNMYIYKND